MAKKRRNAFDKLKTLLFGRDLRITEGEPYTEVREYDFSSYFPRDKYVFKQDITGENVIDILNYNVKVNDFTYNNAPEINRAISDAAKIGGTVYIHSGNYNSGSIVLQSNVTLFIDYDSSIVSDKRKENIDKGSLIYGENVHNITITGGGKISCNGNLYGRKPLFDKNMTSPPEYIDVIEMRRDYRAQLRFAHPSKYGGPICLKECSNVKVNNFTIENSAYWTFRMEMCKNVSISNFIINNNRNVANADGLDIVGGSNITVRHAFISTADDGIVLKNALWLGSNIPMDGVNISDCEIISRTNAVKIGTETTHEIKNINVKNCKFLMTDVYPGSVSGISIESCDGSKVHNITFSDISMDRCTSALFIRVGNRNRASKVTSQSANAVEFGAKGEKGKTISKNVFNHKSEIYDVLIENINATEVELPIIIAGYKQNGFVNNVKNVTLKNINLSYADREETADKRLFIPEYAKEYPECWRFRNLPAYALWARHTENLKIENLTCHHPLKTWKKDKIILK